MYTTSCELSPQPGQPCATYFDNSPCNTPLALSFDGAPVEYLVDAAHTFDVNGARSQITDWPSARTPWLALDRDGNGRVDDGAELYGSMAALSTGRRARNGFEALRDLDADGGGRITPADPGFAKPLRCDARDDCKVERGSFRWRDASGVVRTGAVVDVHLAAQ